MAGLACIGTDIAGFAGRQRRLLILLCVERSGEHHCDDEEKKKQKNAGDSHSAPPHVTHVQPPTNSNHAAIFIPDLVTAYVTPVTKRGIVGHI